MIDQARLHPATVTEVSRGQHTRTRVRTGSNRSSKVDSLVVDPRVWAQAQQILDSAHGYTKITINSETEVTVR